jgi:hypothetical protein
MLPPVNIATKFMGGISTPEFLAVFSSGEVLPAPFAGLSPREFFTLRLICHADFIFFWFNRP